MAGLVAAIGISRFANHWYGGVLPGVADFLTSGIVFFLVIVNVTNVARMRVIAISLAFLSVYLLSRAVYAYHSSEVLSPFLLVRSISGSDAAVGMDARIRALGFLHDPNDFGQFLVVCLPLLGLAWRRGRRVWNVVVVVFPACFLLYGIYLAHSRGALIGLMVLLGMALSKYLHPIGSLAVAGLGMLLLLAPVSGGREISFSEASTSGRLMAWGAGIGMLKSSPIFGVGYDAFQEGYEQTAHNSFVLCFAELGIFGYFFWVGLIVYTLVELNHLLRSIRVTTENESLLRSGQLLRASLAAFLVSAWFLSRTYIMTFYLLISLAVALIQILKAEPTAIPTPAGRGWKLTLAVQAVSILAVYAMVRSRSF
jgi:O-antigen ligase